MCCRSSLMMPGGMRSSFPELLTAKAERFAAAYGIEKNYALQLASSEKLPLFEQAVRKGSNPNSLHSPSSPQPRNSAGTAWRSGRSRTRHISIRGMRWIAARRQGRRSPRSSGVLRRAAPFTDALAKLAPAVSREELEKIVRKIIADRSGLCCAERQGRTRARSWVS